MTEAPGKEGGSFRSIVRSTSLLGGASFINIAISVLKTKVAALLLGPTGIGLIGLLQNLMGTAAAVASLGVGTVGAKRIAQAAADEDERALHDAAQALFWGTLLLSVIGGALFWILRTILSVWLTGGPQAADLIGWLSIGLVATVAGGSQTALLTGLRRLKALAAVSVLSALLGTAAACAALVLLPREAAIAVYLIAAPLMATLVAQLFIRRALKLRPARIPVALLKQHWLAMARLGFWFTAGGLGGAALLLWVRAYLNQALGPVALGHFQASFAISSMYLSFVLAAMGSDYFPRLSGVIRDDARVNEMVNAQAEVLLLLSAPAVFALLGATPLVIKILYSSAFADAAWILRWQIVGDIFKLMAWPLSFVLLAAGEGRTFFATEVLAPAVMLVFLWIVVPTLGIIAAGLAFVVMYGLYLPAVFLLIRRRNGFAWLPKVVWLFVGLLTTSLAILAATLVSEIAAMAFAAVAAAGSAVLVIVRLGGSTLLASSPLAKLFRHSISKGA